MKILIAVTNSFCANFIKGQAAYLINHGHEVIIVSSDGLEIQNLVRTEKAKFHEVKFQKDISLKKDFLALMEVIRIIRTEKPDVINAGNPKPGFIFSIAKIFFFRTPLIFTLRGLRSDTLTGLKKKVVRLTEWFSCTTANKVIVISPSLAEHAERLKILKKRKTILLGRGSSNGIDINHFKSNDRIKQESIKIKERFKIENEFIFLFVGRLTKDKGLTEIITVFSKHYSDSKSKLVLVGPLEQEDPLPRHIKDEINRNEHILQVGKVQDPRPYYELGDVLILNSYREGFGNVVLEAACFEVPAIVSNIPGLKDTIIDHKTGLLSELKSESCLKSKMDLYYNDKVITKEHGINARSRVELEFKNDIIWNGQLKLYKHLTNNN